MLFSTTMKHLIEQELAAVIDPEGNLTKRKLSRKLFIREDYTVPEDKQFFCAECNVDVIPFVGNLVRNGQPFLHLKGRLRGTPIIFGCFVLDGGETEALCVKHLSEHIENHERAYTYAYATRFFARAA